MLEDKIIQNKILKSVKKILHRMFSTYYYGLPDNCTHKEGLKCGFYNCNITEQFHIDENLYCPCMECDKNL